MTNGNEPQETLACEHQWIQVHKSPTGFKFLECRMCGKRKATGKDVFVWHVSKQDCECPDCKRIAKG